MPHKHRRSQKESDSSYFDLPPNKVAHPLAIAQATKVPSKTSTTQSKTRPRNCHPKDDTPRAFTRLFAPYRPPRSGQDDGIRSSKKRKLAHTLSPPPSPPSQNKELKIQPKEPLSYFAARVDAALPFSGLRKSNTPNDPALKDIAKGRRTRTEMKMQRMQREWREAERRRKEKLEGIGRGEEGDGIVDEGGVEEMGLDEEEKEKQEKKEGDGIGKKRTKGKKGGARGEGDPWAHIGAKSLDSGTNGGRSVAGRGGGGGGGLVGLHDVVQAPPRLAKRSSGKEKDEMKLGEGGVKKQIELGEARRSVIEGYRAMMKQKREERTLNDCHYR